MNLKTAILILLSVAVSACSNSQKNPDFDEYLATHIRSEGSKEFYYTVTLTNADESRRGRSNKNVSGGMRVSGGSNSNPRGSGGVTVSGQGNGKGSVSRPGGQGSARASEKMSEQLEKKLLTTGYCRDGWMETERQIQPPFANIRGKCNETATDKDRENFPNSEDISS